MTATQATTRRMTTLTLTSLFSILLMTLHLTSDTLRARPGTAEAGGSTLIAVPVLVLWLWGTLHLGERLSGCIVMMIGGILALGMPVIHVKAAAGMFAGVLAKGNGDFLFVWTLHALGVTGMLSLILGTQRLVELRSGQARAET